MPNEQSSTTQSKSAFPKTLNPSQISFLTQKTPPQFVKIRPGPGGRQYSYVEIGYVVNLLNEAFGWDWDFLIVDQQVGKTQVWVRGELMVRVGNHMITKSQYGGADIKHNRTTNEPISVADDLKAAASDCLKKCASLLGVAGDIYWPDLDSFETTPENL